MGTCRICGRDGIRERLDFGPQAIRNRFLRSRRRTGVHSPAGHRLCCGMCGPFNFVDPPPVGGTAPAIRLDQLQRARTPSR